MRPTSHAPSIHAAAWLAEALGLPFFEGTDTAWAANRVAVEFLGTAPSNLASTLTALGATADAKTLLSSTTEDRPGRVQIPGAEALLFRADDRVALLVVPTLERARNEGSELVDMAAGISHELSNALSAIGGWARVAEERVSTGATAQATEALTLVRNASRSAERTARYFLALARGSDVDEDDEPIDARSVATDVVRLLEPKGRANRIRIELDAPEAAWCRGRNPDLLTIIWNLTQNAVEASPEASSVFVTLRADRTRVVLRVKDQGPGIPAAAAKRVFEPYFTTKRTGTGLGLALTKRAVDRMNGSIRIDPSSDQGACIEVSLPRIDAPPKETPSEPAPRRAPLSILVVDDDAGVRGLIATVLMGDGHEVTSVGSAAEALADARPVDVALIDVGLETMRGDELADELRRRKLVRRVALMSGASLREGVVTKPDLWIRKPFEIEDLRAAIDEIAALR
ncbi:MAG: ATP-binding protein [Polyangiales bacterium]